MVVLQEVVVVGVIGFWSWCSELLVGLFLFLFNGNFQILVEYSNTSFQG